MEALGIDLKLIIAQIINFIILLVVLSKLLYRPIIKMLDERKKKITESLENTKKIEERLNLLEQKEQAVLQEAAKKAKEEKETLLRLANEEKLKIIDEARQAANYEAKKGLSLIQSEEEEAVKRLKLQVTDDLINKIYKKLMDSNKKSSTPILKEILK